jgi:uncharacterized protein YutE (UPF0331/DUF86 family)
MAEPRKADRKRWRLRITERLEDFPRQQEALESAMAEFGEDFDVKRFKKAYESRADMAAYNRAQAVERALGRVQNYVAELAIDGSKMAGLKPIRGTNGEASNAFATLAKAGVIDNALRRRLDQAQKARSAIEHNYVGVPAGTVHRAAELIRDCSREFIGPYRAWIEEFL